MIEPMFYNSIDLGLICYFLVCNYVEESWLKYYTEYRIVVLNVHSLYNSPF